MLHRPSTPAWSNAQDDDEKSPQFSYFMGWDDPNVAQIEPRQWLYGHHYLKGAISATIADGGVGKSTLALTEAIAMVTGRPLLGIAPNKELFNDGAVRDRREVLYYNAEESLTEIKRRVLAICQHFGINPNELLQQGSGEVDGPAWRPAACLMILSGHDAPIILGGPDPNGGIAFNEDAIAFLEDWDADAIILDPFVSIHQCPENDNTLIDAIIKRLAKAAKYKAIEIVHHSRKPAQGGNPEIGAADARGASALSDGVRSLRMLNRMTASEAQQAKVNNPKNFFRVDNGKANYAAPHENSLWFRHKSIILPNGDDVGIVVPFHFPNAFDNVSTDHIHKVRERARNGQYRADPRADPWIGQAVAEVLDLDVEADCKRIKIILKGWYANGVLKRVDRERGAGDRHKVVFVEPGEWTE
jgi:RecA-family ATPase